MLPAMPLQQISVTPLDWQKEHQRASVSEHNWKCKREPVYTATAAPERCTSQASTLSNNGDICRICHCEGEPEAPLIAPCYCSGSLQYVHQACLQQWIKSSDIRCCELCKFEFIMQSKVKPFMQWELLELSSLERRRLFCSVVFHSMAIICVLWSLFVLVDRTLEEVNTGLLEWPFWTKLIIVAVGFTGGIVFVSMQCRGYVQLCRRWRAFNRVIYVQNAPEKVALGASPAPSMITSQDSLLMSGTCCGSVPVDMSAVPMRSTSVLDLSDEPKYLSHPELAPEALAPSHDVAVIPLEHIPLAQEGGDIDMNLNDLDDIAPPPAEFSDAVENADTPSPVPVAVSPSSSRALPESSYGFPLSRMGSGRLSAGYPLLMSTFQPAASSRRLQYERSELAPEPRSSASAGEEVAVTIRPWTVGGSYFLHPAQSGHGLSERWMETRGVAADRDRDRRDSLPVEAVSSSVPLATVLPPDLGVVSYANSRSHR